MAEAEAAKKDEKSGGSEPAKKPESAKGIKPFLIPIGAAVLVVVVGFGVGRLFGTRGKALNVGAAEVNMPAEVGAKGHGKEAKEEKAGKEEKGGKEGKGEKGEKGEKGSRQGATKGTWYYDTEAVIVNLNEPGVSRYVRLSLTLEMGNGLTETEGKSFLDLRKPLMKNWLTLFLSNQTVDDIRGEKNLRQMLAKIMDIFNENLFPDAKPRVVGVYFKEYSIQ
jgi:flagellar basal body-associated protein FliL